MLTEIITGVVLAIISGLTYIAYKHPKGYRKMFLPLDGIAFFIISIINAYNHGIISSISRLKEHLNEDQLKEIIPVIESGKFLNAAILLLIFTGFIIFISFLYFLPDILENESD